jgi:hypothetical protein
LPGLITNPEQVYPRLDGSARAATADDQEGRGATIAIVRRSIARPVAAFKAWVVAAGITTGPVFRPVPKGERIQHTRLTDHSVATIIKAHAARVGLDPACFSGHSLRSGFLTSAAGRGASIFKMMDVSRHRSVQSLRGYVRDAELFRDEEPERARSEARGGRRLGQGEVAITAKAQTGAGGGVDAPDTIVRSITEVIRDITLPRSPAAG